jgi:hypothetical protein
MTDPVLSRRLDTTAWSTILLGLLCLFLAALQAVAPVLLRNLGAMLEDPDDPRGPCARRLRPEPGPARG